MSFAFIRLLFGGVPWKLWAILGGAVVVFGALAYGVHTIKRAGALEALLDSTIQIANTNAEIAKRDRALHDKADSVKVDTEKLKSGIRRKADANTRSIIDALPQDDGVLAPVLRDALDRLPAPPGADSSKPAPQAGSRLLMDPPDTGPDTAAARRHAARGGPGRQ